MNLQKYKSMVDENVIQSMLDMIEDMDEDEAEFTQTDVEACRTLMYRYLDALATLSQPDNGTIMKQVKALVLALNDLNEQADFCLIETMEREAIAEIIQESAIECGLTDASDDITEEWRDW